MATVRKRGASWQAQVRRKGYSLLTKTFPSRADAVAWARERERSIDRSELSPRHLELRRVTLGDLLERYGREITPKKRGAAQEAWKLQVVQAHPISRISLESLTGSILASYRDDRSKAVSPATVRRELALVGHCIEVARKEWDVPLSHNPVRQISLPRVNDGRDRRLKPEEATAFWMAVERSRAAWVAPFVTMAVETGMRRGELLSIRWKDVDLNQRVIRVRTTKNGYERVVPLTPCATQVLSTMVRRDDRVFPLNAFTVRQAWVRVCERSGISDLRLHDLRHEAVSRFFELGLSVPEVALISGHRDPRMLSRYTHLRPENIAAKLAKLLPAPELKDGSDAPV